MSTTTTRLGLVKPASGENYDIGVVNGNSDKLDAAAGLTVATSGTRPAAPFDGRGTFETDTNELVVPVGGAWVPLGTTAATADRLARRGTGGTLLVGAATADGHAPTWLQMKNADAAVAQAAADALLAAVPADIALTAVTYSTGWATYIDAGLWDGVKYWRRGETVTVSGAIQASSARANGDPAFTLPATCRPPSAVQVAMNNGAPFAFVIMPTGVCRLTGAAASGAIVSFGVSFAIA